MSLLVTGFPSSIACQACQNVRFLGFQFDTRSDLVWILRCATCHALGRVGVVLLPEAA